jgi:high-affinity iron transporter
MILIGALFPLLLAPADTTAHSQADRAPVVRRIAAGAQLAAQEYRLGVAGGRIVAPAEVSEAKLFLEEAKKGAAGLPDSAAMASLDSLIRLVAAVAPADTVASRVRTLTEGIAARFGVTLDELPRTVPSLARGAEVYQQSCAMCHGVSGGGDGSAAAGLDPAPTPLRDWKLLADQSPLDFYRRVSIGVVGTAMPAFEGRLSAEDRWAVALYASVLRLPPAAGSPPPALHPFTTSGRMSDAALLEALGAPDDGSGDGLARVAAVRSRQEEAAGAATAEVFGRVRAQADSARSLAETGNPAAPASALDAYMTFEQVERSVRAKDPALAAELEADFAALRAAAAGTDRAELSRVRSRLDANLERAESALGSRLGPLNLFVQSFVILLREGLEAILIVGALLTFLVKMGAGDRRRDVHLGVGAAVVASLLTAVALETVFQITPASREALEGITMVVATVVLFYVSYWLLSKMEVVKWNHFVKSKVHQAVTSGSALALASAAFLAVYREGFETVLFYKALFLAGNGSAGVMPVVAGMAVGAVVLAAVYVAIHRFGIRLPLKPFFGVTSAFLYYMAFIFAGQGIAELQEGGLLSTTPVAWAPRVPALGLYPTVESLLAQGVLLVLLVVAVVWTFVLEPRRLRVSQVLVPDPVPAPAPVKPATHAHSAPVTSGTGFELIRSLERMEADLAEIRSEVERMKRYVHELHHTRSV